MDLAIGARETWVMMDLLTRQGRSKVVERCTYPLTGIGCVRRIYSDLATLACTPQGLQLIDLVDGLDRAGLERLVGLPIRAPDDGAHDVARNAARNAAHRRPAAE
jgi:3-oxoadipate CoA-transferase beta subunit